MSGFRQTCIWPYVLLFLQLGCNASHRASDPEADWAMVTVKPHSAISAGESEAVVSRLGAIIRDAAKLEMVTYRSYTPADAIDQSVLVNERIGPILIADKEVQQHMANLLSKARSVGRIQYLDFPVLSVTEDSLIRVVSAEGHVGVIRVIYKDIFWAEHVSGHANCPLKWQATLLDSAFYDYITTISSKAASENPVLLTPW